MSKQNQKLIAALTAAEKHFAKEEYQQGVARQTEALTHVGVRPSQTVKELLAIHFCRAGYLAACPELLQKEKQYWIEHPDEAVDMLVKETPRRFKQMFAQLNKSYEWIQKLDLSALDRETRTFLAQSRYAAGLFKILKFNLTKTDGSSIKLDMNTVSVEEAMVCVEQAKTIMRATADEERTQRDLLYIKSYSLMTMLIKKMPEKFGFEGVEAEEYDASYLSDAETEELMRPVREAEERRHPPFEIVYEEQNGRISVKDVNLGRHHASENMRINNYLKLNDEAQTAEKLFADKVKILLPQNSAGFVGKMFHYSEPPKEKSELTYELSYQVTP